MVNGILNLSFPFGTTVPKQIVRSWLPLWFMFPNKHPASNTAAFLYWELKFQIKFNSGTPILLFSKYKVHGPSSNKSKARDTIFPFSCCPSQNRHVDLLVITASNGKQAFRQPSFVHSWPYNYAHSITTFDQVLWAYCLGWTYLHATQIWSSGVP